MSLLDFFHPKPRNPIAQQTLDDLSSEEDEEPEAETSDSALEEEMSSDRTFMVNTFRKTGLSLAIGGSEDDEMSFAGVDGIRFLNKYFLNSKRLKGLLNEKLL
jgi:hypothetical protein